MINWISHNIRENLNVNLVTKTKQTSNKSNVFFIQAGSFKSVYKILNWLYKDTDDSIRLNRKYERYLHYKTLTSDKILDYI